MHSIRGHLTWFLELGRKAIYFQGGGGGGWSALAKYFWGAGKHCQNVISFKKGLAFVRLRPEEPPLSISVLLSVRLSSSATNV